MSAKEIQANHRKLLMNLRLLQKIHSAKTMSEIVGVQQSTWYNYMKEPWKRLTFDNLMSIASFCKVNFVKLTTGDLYEEMSK